MANDSPGPSVFVRYGGAAGAVSAAAVAGWLSHGALGPAAALAPLHAVVALVALVWGGGPGVFATALGAAAASVWSDRGDAVGVGAFVAVGLAVSGTASALRRRAGGQTDAGPETGGAWGEQFRALVQASSDVVYRMSPDWAEMRYLLGREFLPDTDAPSQTWLQKYIHPDDQPHVLSVITEAVRTKSVFELEHRVRRTDGTLGWTCSRAVPILDVTGAVREWLGTATDVTPRREAEEALRRSEERLRLALAGGRIGVWEWDVGTDRLSWSPELYAITGLEPAAFGGTRDDYVRLVHPEDRDLFQTQIETVLAAGDGFEVEHRIVCPDLGVRWLMSRGEVIRSPVGQADRVLGVAADVTDRKAAEAALGAEKAYAESIVETLHEPLLVLHPDLTVKGVNAAFYTHFRVDPGDTIGRKVYELGNGQWAIPALRTLLEDVLPANKVFNDYEVTHEFETIGRRVMLVNGRRLDYVQLILLGIRDITDRKRAEDELRAGRERLAAEAAALGRLNAAGSILWATLDESEGLAEVLAAAIDLLGADMGNVQLLDPERGVLTIAAHRGFGPDFLATFREVSGEHDSACGRALRSGVRMVIEDVEADEAFTPFRPSARAAGYRAVQSTPLVGRDGRPLGMISTHFRSPHRPGERALRWLDLFVRLAADLLERCRTGAKLREGEERQAFLLKLSDALRSLTDVGAIQQTACRLLGEQLGTSRLGYAETDDGGETFEVRHQHTAGVPELTGQLRTAYFGAGLADHLRAGRRGLWADVAANPALSAAEREAFAAAGVAAEAVLPLVKGGRLVGVLFAHFDRPHDWSPLEVALLEETAERTWAAVARARAEAALRGSRDTFLGLVRDAPFGVYLVDAGFRLVEVSAGSQKVFAGVHPLFGRDFAEVLRAIWPEPFASEAIDRFRHTLATGEPYHSADTTEPRHDVPVVESYDWRIERVGMPDGGAGVVCYFYETTELRRAAARDAFRARLADALRPLADPDEMKATTCRLLVRHLAAGRASYAEVEPDDAHVVIAAEFTDNMPSFAGRHRADDFGPTVITALRAGHTVVTNDVAEHPGLTTAERAAYAAVGIRALVVVPLNKGGRWIAALGVNAAAPRAWTADEVGLVEEVAERMWAAVERAKAEAALRVSAEWLRLAVRASNIGLWDWDLKTDVVVYSPEWKAQIGYAEDEIRDDLAEWECRIHPDDRGSTLDRVRRTIAGPDSSYEVEFRLRHKDGSWRWIFTRAEVIRHPGGAAVRILGCHLDVTTRRQSEEALREREARLSAILGTAADAIITIDRTGVIETVNQAAEQMFGYAPGELVGRNVSVLMPPPHRDRHDGYIARYIATGEARIIGVGREMTARRKDGTPLPVELAVSEIDHLRQFTGIVRDITLRKELEREVVEAASEEQRRIGQDLHDTVGQELTALAIRADDLADALRTDPPAAPGLADRIGQGLRRCQQELRTVIRGLLPVAVDAEGLMAALADLADRMAREGRVGCTFECPKPVAVSDNLTATQLYMIAQEAVHNAVTHAQPRAVRISLAPAEGGGLVLRVADDGLGMPSELPPGRGQGLRIMGHRASIIGALLAVGPADPTGTVVTCELVGGDRG